MSDVIEKEFLHIHRLNDNSNCPNKHAPKWVQGGVLTFGIGSIRDNNLLHDRVFNPYININYEKNLIKQLAQRKIVNSSNNTEIQNAFLQQGLMFKYFQLTREIVLEEVRQSLFPDKPSRLSGIWLFDQCNIKTWSKIFPKDNFSQKLFLVKFTGKIHKADARWITNRTISFSSYYKNALGYWNGLQQSKRGRPDDEYIGNGIVKIVKEITFSA